MAVQISAGAAIIEDNSVLLIRRAVEPCIGIWSLPIGGVDRGETVTECAVREAKEDTGLEVMVEKLIGIYSSVDMEIVLLIFAAHPIAGLQSLSHEVREAVYFKGEHLPPSQQEFLRNPYNLWASGTNRAILLRVKKFLAA